MVSFFGLFGKEEEEAVEVVENPRLPFDKEAPFQTLINIESVLNILESTRDELSTSPKTQATAQELDGRISELKEFKLEFIKTEVLGSE